MPLTCPSTRRRRSRMGPVDASSAADVSASAPGGCAGVPATRAGRERWRGAGLLLGPSAVTIGFLLVLFVVSIFPPAAPPPAVCALAAAAGLRQRSPPGFPARSRRRPR